MRLPIKPLSVNKAWRGGPRYKTDEYKRYERDVCLLLRKLDIPDGPLSITLEFGVPAKMDWDNSVKPFVDILQHHYGFDDVRIMSASVRKVVVPKGQEYIEFELSGQP